MSGADIRMYRLVKAATVILLIGKGFLHFTAPQPYNILFGNVSVLTFVFGGYLVLTGSMLLLPERFILKTRMIYALVGSSCIIFIHSFGTFKAVNYLPEQLIEHGLQIFLPLIFVHLVFQRKHGKDELIQAVTISLALTFIGHGVYAVGVHGVPGHFILMTNECLSFNSLQSVNFLFIIGILDIALACALFVPKMKSIALWYMIVWGILTSLARTYYVLGDEITMQFWFENIPNTVYRLPHGLIPLALLIFHKKSEVLKVEKNPTGIYLSTKTMAG